MRLQQARILLMLLLIITFGFSHSVLARTVAHTNYYDNGITVSSSKIADGNCVVVYHDKLVEFTGNFVYICGLYWVNNDNVIYDLRLVNLVDFLPSQATENRRHNNGTGLDPTIDPTLGSWSGLLLHDSGLLLFVPWSLDTCPHDDEGGCGNGPTGSGGLPPPD